MRWFMVLMTQRKIEKMMIQELPHYQFRGGRRYIKAMAHILALWASEKIDREEYARRVLSARYRFPVESGWRAQLLRQEGVNDTEKGAV